MNTNFGNSVGGAENFAEESVFFYPSTESEILFVFLSALAAGT